MPTNNLSIIVEAEVKQAAAEIEALAKSVGVDLKKGESVIIQFEAAIKQLEKTTKASTTPEDLIKNANALKQLNDAFNQVKNPIAAFGKSTTVASAGVTTIAKQTPNATNALTNFGRVIQDAPFGIIGIANNIDPLIASFQQLSKQSGGTGSALKALGSAFLGPAGIAIGVSAVTSALIAFGPQIKAFFAKTSESEKAATAFAESMKELTEATDKFSSAANSLAGKDLASINALIGGISNLNTSQKERIFFVDELQKKYPAYFGSLSKEEILAGQTADAYKRLTVDIIAASKARAAQDVLSKIASQQLALEEQKALLAAETEKKIAGAKTGSITFTGSSTGTGTSTTTVTAEEKKAQALAGQAAKLGVINIEYDKLNKQAAFYTKFVTDASGATARLGEKVTGAAKATKDLSKSTIAVKELTAAEKENAAFLASVIPLRQADLTVQRATTAEIERATLALKEKRKAEALGKFGAGLAPEIIDPNKGFAAAKVVQEAAAATAAETAQLKLLEEQGAKAQLAFSLLSPAIDGVFNALSNGDDPLKALGQSIKQLIVQLIKAVVQAAILSAIMNAIAPGAGAASGGGFLNLLKGFIGGGRATGGPTMPNTPYLVGENGPEIMTPGAGVITPMGQGGGTLTTAVSGNQLLFILNQAQSNRRNNFG